jgi:DNA-binding protein Fis/DNA-binding TFAR19-related protein (PDSD5 family)
MAPKYQNGKIYKIESYLTDDIYIGSTTQLLCNRIAKHKANYKYWLNGKSSNVSSNRILEQDENAFITLIENYPCNNRAELEAREGYYIRSLDCVNKKVAGRTPKQFRLDNIEDIKQQKKQYYEKNKEQHSQRMKQYRSDNKDNIKQILKHYYADNIEKIKLQRKEIIHCDLCDKDIGKHHIARHNKSKKHIEENRIKELEDKTSNIICI